LDKSYEKQMQNIDDFPHIKRWLDRMDNRPAVQRAYALAEKINPQKEMSDEAKRILFGQSAVRDK